MSAVVPVAKLLDYGPTKQKAIVVKFWLRLECDGLAVPKVLLNLIRLFAAAEMDTKILTDKECVDLNERVFERCAPLAQCSLLLRGTEHGFDAAKFHEVCDGKSPTLTVVLTEFGHVIGAFTNVPWTSPETFAYAKDTGAWLFVSRVSECKKKRFAGVKMPAIFTAHIGDGNQVFHDSRSGPTFGLGHDLHVANDCDSNADSYVAVNDSYVRVTGLFLDSMAITGGITTHWGKSEFRVLEYEVFLCK